MTMEQYSKETTDRIIRHSMIETKTMLEVILYLLKKTESEVEIAEILDCRYNFIAEKLKEIRKSLELLMMDIHTVTTRK